ncbi:MAG: helix-turn-helix domain-containing protein [Saprospiraceae bacterium]
MKKFPSSKYPITPITDEETYMRFCDWVEYLDELTFDDEDEEEKKFAHLDALTILIEAYEAKHFQFKNIQLSLVQVIEQALEQLKLNKKDLAKILGSNRVSEIFSGKRNLSLAQIRILHKELHIPAEILIRV